MTNGTPKVLNPYPAIWLQVGEIERDCDIHEIYREGDITWCQDQQFNTDVKYVLASAMDAEVEALKTKVAELEKNYECLRRAGHKSFCRQERKIEALRRAVEHAEYLAKAADRFFAADNAWQEAVMAHEEEDSEKSGEAVDAERESKSEARKALASAAYEFRKRAAVALSSA